MRFQCLIIILVLTNYLVQSYYTPTQSDFTNVEEMLKNILNKYITPLQKHVGQLINNKANRVLRPKCLCGRSKASSRIVNGNTVEKNEFPWQVRLKYNHDPSFLCSGSIISKKNIVTSAKCMDEVWHNELRVIVAEHDVTKSDGEKYYRVCNLVKHPGYKKNFIGKYDYNYAILTLCKELTWGPSVAPVCLPSPEDAYLGKKYENKNAIVSGWGSTLHNPHHTSNKKMSSKLQKVTVRTLTNSECRAKQKYFNKKEEINSRTICAAGKNKGPCVGDEGGPLVVQDPELGAYVLVGITASVEPPCGGRYNLGLYARVTNQIKWINKNINGPICSMVE